MMPAPDVGPLARKMLNSFQKLKKQKVVDLAVYRKGRDEMERIFRERARPIDDEPQRPQMANRAHRPTRSEAVPEGCRRAACAGS